MAGAGDFCVSMTRARGRYGPGLMHSFEAKASIAEHLSRECAPVWPFDWSAKHFVPILAIQGRITRSCLKFIYGSVTFALPLWIWHLVSFLILKFPLICLWAHAPCNRAGAGHHAAAAAAACRQRSAAPKHPGTALRAAHRPAAHPGTVRAMLIARARVCGSQAAGSKAAG